MPERILWRVSRLGRGTAVRPEWRPIMTRYEPAWSQVNGACVIRVLVVEDRPEIRYGLEMRLDAEPDMQVVGLAADGLAALTLASEVLPDVVLMDVEMPALDGIETCRMLCERHPRMPVVMLSIHDDAGTQDRAALASAAGFVSKEEPVDRLLSVIREAALRHQPLPRRQHPTAS